MGHLGFCLWNWGLVLVICMSLVHSDNLSACSLLYPFGISVSLVFFLFSTVRLVVPGMLLDANIGTVATKPACQPHQQAYAYA